MGLATEYEESIEGYETVPLAVERSTTQTGGAMLRRRAARPSTRAVIYVHYQGDPFVPADVVAWFTDRGFHFYAADLRGVAASREAPESGGTAGAAGELAACLTFLDGVISHLRATEGIGTVVVCAHAAGALVAALWCHARRGCEPVAALILTGPDLGPGRSWPGRGRAPRRQPAAARRASPLLAGAQRRLRHGLDISCPVLVMCPAGGWDVPGGPGGLLARRALSGGRVTMRLGEHVTWMKMDEGLPGEVLPAGPGRARFFDELGRWLSAYLSRELRDQLL